MEIKNIYLGNSVHHDHSRNTEINLGSASAADISRIIRAFWQDSDDIEDSEYAEVEESDARKEPEAEVCHTAAAEEAASSPEGGCGDTAHQKMRWVVETLRSENVLKNQYDFLWVMLATEHYAGKTVFKSPREFLDYLGSCGVAELPSVNSLQRKNNGISCECRIDQWTFSAQTGRQEAQRRINVGKRTFNLLKQAGFREAR